MRIALPEAHQMQPLAHLSEHYASEIVNAGMNFSAVTYQMSKLPMRLFEGARYRTALINGCELCQNFRVARDRNTEGRSITHNGPAPDEAFYQAVHEYKSSPLLSSREKLAIEYAEGLGLYPQALARDEDFWARFKAEFSDDEIVDLAYCIAVWMGIGRVAHALGLDGVCAIPAMRTAA